MGVEVEGGSEEEKECKVSRFSMAGTKAYIRSDGGGVRGMCVIKGINHAYSTYQLNTLLSLPLSMRRTGANSSSGMNLEPRVVLQLACPSPTSLLRFLPRGAGELTGGGKATILRIGGPFYPDWTINHGLGDDRFGSRGLDRVRVGGR